MPSADRHEGRSSIAVIVPCLNEEAVLRPTLEAIAAQDHPHEIIIVDGGSTDATLRVAKPYGRVLRASRGRASQMNAGAAAAASDVLVFLHADTLLPNGALKTIRQTLNDPSVEAGAFRLRFDRPTPLLRFYSFCTRFRIARLCFGDRGLFVRRRVFDEVGGFPSVPMFEDVELVRILSERSGFVFLEDSVTTSARRFRAAGSLRQQALNACLWLSYLAGADLHRLTDYYPYPGTGNSV